MAAKTTCRDSKGRFKKASACPKSRKGRRSKNPRRKAGTPLALPSSGAVGDVSVGRDGSMYRIALNSAGRRYWASDPTATGPAVGQVRPQTQACAAGKPARSKYRTPKVAPGCVIRGTKMRGNDGRDYVVCGDKNGDPRWFLAKNAPCAVGPAGGPANPDVLAEKRAAGGRAGGRDYKPILQQQMMPVEGGWAPLAPKAPTGQRFTYASPLKGPLSTRQSAALGLSGAAAAAGAAGAFLSDSSAATDPKAFQLDVGGPDGNLEAAKGALAGNLAAPAAVPAVQAQPQNLSPAAIGMQYMAGQGGGAPAIVGGANVPQIGQ